MSRPVNQPPPADGSGRPESSTAESKLAKQISSEGGLIAQYGPSKLYFENVPLLGRIEHYFAQGTAKQKLIGLIQTSFPSNDLKSILSEFKLGNLFHIQNFISNFGTFIFPQHTNSTREWVHAFTFAQEIIQNPELGETFKLVTDKFKQAPFEAKHQFAEALVAAKKTLSKERWILACKTLNAYLNPKPDYLINQTALPLITSYFEVAALLGGRLEEKNYRTFLDEFFKFSKTDEFYTGLQDFHTFLDLAKKIQLERPKIYNSLHKPEFFAAYLKAQSFFPSDEYGFIQNLIKEVCDETVVFNTQILQEAIESFYLKKNPHISGYGYLHPRTAGSDISLSQELKQGVFLEESDEIINFPEEFELLVTNPKTEETRSVTFRLPISGEMTRKEAIGYLKLLTLAIADPRKFDQKHEGIDLTSTEKEKFLTWCKKNEKELAKLFHFFFLFSSRGFLVPLHFLP